MSKFPFFLFPTLLVSTSALALSCYDGSTGCIDAKQAADDCLNLGYSLNEPECEHYLLCPFNTDYKVCVKEKAGNTPAPNPTDCPENYTLSPDGTRCITKCEAGCPKGSIYITSEDQITGDGTYCLGEKSITLTFDSSTSNYKGPRSLTFYPSTHSGNRCNNKSLIITGTMPKIVSYAYTFIKDGAKVYDLELHFGGTFEAPMVCGSYSINLGHSCEGNISGENCVIHLYGNQQYTFPYYNVGATNLPSYVKCHSENGTNPILIFKGSDFAPGFLFNGSASFTLGSQQCVIGNNSFNSCSGQTCYRYVKDTDLGTPTTITGNKCGL